MHVCLLRVRVHPVNVPALDVVEADEQEGAAEAAEDVRAAALEEGQEALFLHDEAEAPC